MIMGCLKSTLADTIRDKKTFVVLDDMWTAAKWNDVLKASFSYVARGSRVLVTTRDDRVARSMKAQYLHHVNYLGPQDAWTLLKKEVRNVSYLYFESSNNTLFSANVYANVTYIVC